MGWLEDEVALITGAGSGLGKALVERFVEEGARVLAMDLDDQRARDVAAPYGGSVLGVAGNITVARDNQRAVNQCLESFGKLDVFVGNAGIFDYGAKITETPIEQLDSGFDEVMGVNVKGHLLGVKAALPALMESRGNVLLTASMSSWHAGIGGVVYTASKHALLGVVRQLAFELAPHVRVNGVAPGFMRTDIRGPHSFGLGEVTPSSVIDLDAVADSATPMKLLPRPKDYTGHYVQLASRANAIATTGVVVETDGGISVRGLTMPPAPRDG